MSLKKLQRLFFDRYEIVQSLGNGGMGEVYKAKDHKLDVEVALKIQKLTENESPKSDQYRFLKEARAMRMLGGHPNIISIFDINGFYWNREIYQFISFEYLSRGDLSKVIKTLSYEDALRYSLDICNGILHAHKFDILHRDIKPSNLLICDDNSIKITDFGLAKFTAEVTDEHTAKNFNSRLYSAPEQDRKDYKPSFKTDIYQLGATLYHLFTKKNHKQTEGIITPTEINRQIDKDISNMLLKALSNSQYDRFNDVGEMRDILEKAYKKQFGAPQYANSFDIDGIVQQASPFVNIRKIIKDKIADVVKGFNSRTDPVFPKNNEERNWYATVLLRPMTSDGEMSNVLQPIFFCHFDGSKIKSTSDWVSKSNLIRSQLPIDNCCSGLPILFYDHRSKWKKYENELWTCEWDKKNRVLSHFILRDVYRARFEMDENNLIKRYYATDKEKEQWDNGVGWDLIDKDGNEYPMSQNIKTEILIPLYNPSNQTKKKKIKGKNDIIGVANFEWDEKFGIEREEHIASFLSTYIQEENTFGIGAFIGEILPFITINRNNTK